MLITKVSIATYEFGRIPLDELVQAQEIIQNKPIIVQLFEALQILRWCFWLVFRTNSVKKTKNREEYVKTLLILRFFTAIGHVLISIYFFVLLSVTVVVCCLTIPAFSSGCRGCLVENSPTAFATIVLASTLAVIHGFFITFKCRNLPDVWGIYHEGVTALYFAIFAFIAWIIVVFGNFQGKYYFLILFMLAAYGSYSITSIYQLYLGRKSDQDTTSSFQNEYSTHNTNATTTSMGNASSQPLSKLTRTSIANDFSLSFDRRPSLAPQNSCLPILDHLKQKYPKLQEISTNPILFRQFEYHLSTEYGMENLSFLQDIYEWKKSFLDVSRSASLSRAKKLINTYIKDGGLYQINISSDMAKELLNYLKVSSDEESLQVTADIFDPASLEIARLLEIGAATRFFQTSTYKDYVSTEVVINATLASTLN